MNISNKIYKILHEDIGLEDIEINYSGKKVIMIKHTPENIKRIMKYFNRKYNLFKALMYSSLALQTVPITGIIFAYISAYNACIIESRRILVLVPCENPYYLFFVRSIKNLFEFLKYFTTSYVLLATSLFSSIKKKKYKPGKLEEMLQRFFDANKIKTEIAVTKKYIVIKLLE